MDIVVVFDMSRGESGDAGVSWDAGESVGVGTSIDALAYFERTRDYISGAFLKEFLRKGDTFHLISFADTPRMEISRRIEGEGDYRTIIGRLLLLYPLARGSSLENAAAYAEAFVSELPPSRQKKVVFFTAKSGIAAEELGVRFHEKAEVFLASIPGSFETLASGRAMTKAPPQAAPPANTARSPVPAAPPVLAAPPVPLPKAETPPVLNPPDITAVLMFPESQPLPGGDAEPALFDRMKALTVILSVAVMILLVVLTLACIVTWKKRDCDTYTLEDYLHQLNGNTEQGQQQIQVRYGIISARGLLQKASAVKEQLA
jgi:hypothetical protein